MILTFIVLFTFLLLRNQKDAHGDLLTTSDRSAQAFSQPLATLNAKQKNSFLLGKLEFHGLGNDKRSPSQRGIGPLYNAINCSECHINDGRGDPNTSPSSLIKIYNSKNFTDPIYGAQIQNLSTDSLSEAEVKIANDKPEIEKLNLGPLDTNSFTYIRTASPIFGMGLIEAIDNDWLKSNQDPEDENNDGISGRIGETKDKVIAKFGAKANIFSVKEQVLLAASEDMGITSDEISEEDLNNLVFYSRAIAPPKAKKLDKESKAGKKIFSEISCASCHIENAKIGKSDLYTFSESEISPYSDFLLHNMGSKLADKENVGDLASDEFKTAPLWGLGLRSKVNSKMFLLHDGRASTFKEAILYHGGEARESVNQYKTLSKEEKDQLISYLNSL